MKMPAPGSFLNKVAGLSNFIKKETLTQVFSREFCETFKNTYFEEHLQTAASDSVKHLQYSFYAAIFGTKYSRMDQVKF